MGEIKTISFGRWAIFSLTKLRDSGLEKDRLYLVAVVFAPTERLSLSAEP